MLIEGEAGVGKSRWSSELAAELAADGGLVLVGHCVELGEGVPYAPMPARWPLAERLEPA